MSSIEIITSDVVTVPGFYRMSHTAYHRDPCPSRSLSASVLHTLLTRTPMHANAKYKRPPSAATGKMDFGSAVHKLSLDRGADIVQVAASDWRTNAAKEQREVAYANHQIPLLEKDYERAAAMSAPLRSAIEKFTGHAMNDCHRELVMAWQENGQWRRSMIDVIDPDFTNPIDAKTTKASVSPMQCEKRIYDAYGIQAAFYLRGLNALLPDMAGRRNFYFIFGEVDEPFAVSPPIKLSESGLQMCTEQVEHGCKLWDHCVRTDDWFGYSAEVYTAQPPPWVLSQWAAGVVAGNEIEQESDDAA